jgi:MFS family permease
MMTTFRSLSVRNFRLFFVGQAVSQIGNWMRMVAMTLLIFHITDSGVAVGVLTACQFAPVLLLGPWAGLIADRSDKRKLLLIVQTVAMAQSFTLAAFAFMDAPPVGALYVVALLGGIATAFDNPARRSFVVEMVPDEYVQNGVALNTAMMTGSRIFGPALAGLLVTTVGFAWCFIVDGLSYIAVLIGLWRMNTGELRPAPQAIRAKGQVREGLRYVHRTPELWVSLVMMAVIGTFAFNFSVTMPLYATRSLGGTEGMFTLLFSVVSIGSLAGSLWSARRESVELQHVVLASFGFAAAMLLLAVAPSLAFAFPAAVFVGLGSIVFMTSSTALLQLRADPSMRGRVLALQAMVFLGSTPVGGPVVGAICEVFGARVGLGVGAASCLGAGLWGLNAGRRVLHREQPADEIVASGAELQSA